MKKQNAAILLFIAIAFYGHNVFAQAKDSALIKRLEEQITYLSSDKLEGRLTGSKGEKKASSYIIKQYKQIGIVPKGSDGKFLQPFTFTSGKKHKGKNELLINTQKIGLGNEYFPVNVSTNGKVKGPVVDVGYGIMAPTLNYDSYKGITDLKGKIFLMESSSPEGDDPHSQYGPYADIKSKIDNAVKKGATAVIFTNTNAKADDLTANLDIKTFEAPIPVVFLRSEIWKKVKRNELNVASLTVNLKTISVTGHNVIGFLDNGATGTVVIGAHYDHLGYNELGGSLYRGDPAIHNGADDNASGTSGVIELARWLATNGVTEKNNFLFMNFSGEEEGLIGSKYWVEHSTYDTSKINYMINMDMIGRYNPEKGVEISGIGTSPEAFKFIRDTSSSNLKFKIGEHGTGPTDHTSFYLANIPVLNFFTGTHEDYHKPSDDEEKINYAGEGEILQFIENIILQLDGKGTLPFSKTKETDNSNVPQFKVRLGIIPDYLFEGPGLRVDGVNEDQPAAKAGIQKGDIIISIGQYKVTDIMGYMKALAAFHKGDTTDIVVTRNKQEKQLKVTF